MGANGTGQRAAGGTVHIDGSYRGVHWRSARAAWAAVGLDEGGKWQCTYSGALKERHVSSYRAELAALLEVLRITWGPIHISCDNLEVVKGHARGRKGVYGSGDGWGGLVEEGMEDNRRHGKCGGDRLATRPRDMATCLGREIDTSPAHRQRHG